MPEEKGQSPNSLDSKLRSRSANSPPSITMASSEFPASFVEPWKRLLESRRADQLNDFPDLHVDKADSLITTSSIKSLHVGTGYSIFKNALLPAILDAQRSVNLVTCYWSASPTLSAIRETILELAARRRQKGFTKPLRISIGFSSSGLFQKLFHTSSRDGCVIPPWKWQGMGLPDESMLWETGIEMTVKSLFFTPISVMHSKYVIVDGERLFVPSCNVSWEEWFEGCVELQGGVVKKLSEFHRSVWNGIQTPARMSDTAAEDEAPLDGQQDAAQAPIPVSISSAAQSEIFDPPLRVPTIFLPSSHHRNPKFSFFPKLAQSDPPMTPLNAGLLTLFNNAQRNISILTPNITAWPVMDALLEALQRGVDVQIRTSKNMMTVEQLVTAGTTTAWCLETFISKYKELESRTTDTDSERQTVPLGKLEILYYKPLEPRQPGEGEPVLSHFKMTFVDGEYLVLGSGNMDRASWWTSQEIGVLFYVPGFTGYKMWDEVLARRTETVFHSRI